MEITFETKETFVLREGARVAVEHCVGCGTDVVMLTTQAAAFLSGISERHIFRLLEADRVHFTECDRVMVCLESVRRLRLIEL